MGTFSRIQKYALVGLGAAGGAVVYYFSVKPAKTNVVLNSWTTSYTPSVKWDCNWDHRDPKSIIRPSKGTPDDDNRYNTELESATSHAVRHVFLIRHGQYNLDGKTDKERVLTELGRQQARMTGKRLKELGITFDRMQRSTMTRAQETAALISEFLPSETVYSDCSLLEEGAPIPPEPPVGHWRPEPQQFYQEGARIEAAFRRHIHRAKPSQKKDSYTLVVCHANVIRYIVCRAMQFPPEAWLRISLNHASITWLSIHPNGRVILRSLGDTGFMEPKYITSR